MINEVVDGFPLTLVSNASHSIYENKVHKSRTAGDQNQEIIFAVSVPLVDPPITGNRTQARPIWLVFGVCIVFTLNCPRPAKTIEAGDAILFFCRWRQGPLNERAYTQ